MAGSHHRSARLTVLTVAYGLFWFLMPLAILAGFFLRRQFHMDLAPFFLNYSRVQIDALPPPTVLDMLNSSTSFMALQTACVVLLVLMPLILAVITYQLWVALPPHRARLDPLRASVVLLIPAIHLLWAFVAFVGFAKDANRILQARALSRYKINTDVAIGMCATFPVMVLSAAGVLSRIAILSGAGILASVACLIFAWFYFAQARKAAVAIAGSNRRKITESPALSQRNEAQDKGKGISFDLMR